MHVYRIFPTDVAERSREGLCEECDEVSSKVGGGTIGPSVTGN